jgi:hypothetical protein
MALTQFAPEDDLLHDEFSAGSPLARESLALTAPLPEHGLLLFAYVWREGGTKWGRFLAVAGDDPAKPEYISFSADAAYAGEDLRDFTVDGLHTTQPEPLKTTEISFADGEIDLSLRFEGTHAPFTWRDNDDGCPPWMAHDRYEQSGLTSGRLTLRGREIEFTGFGHRDHSWGTRNWNYFQHWKWINAGTPDGSMSLHCCLIDSQGRTFLNGYTNRNGVLSRLVSAKPTFELDESMMHRQVGGEFVDETGATMRLSAEHKAAWAMPIATLKLHEVGMTAVLDGQAATAHVEMGWPATHVDGIVGSA